MSDLATTYQIGVEQGDVTYELSVAYGAGPAGVKGDQGIPGPVSSVAGISPDDSGNVALTADSVGAVPTSRTVNGYDLTADRTLDAADVGALSTDFTPVPTWTTLTLGASATVPTGCQAPRYCKDWLGFVHLEGVCSGADVSKTLATLPAGYRPAGKIAWYGAAISGITRLIVIGTDGTITFAVSTGAAGTGNSDYVDISCVFYPA